MRSDTAETYRRFARSEAAGRSAAYEALARHVADDPVILGFLETLPPLKRQPNLLFAGARALNGRPLDGRTLHEVVIRRAHALRTLLLARRTQTNEVGRCAVLLPALSGLEGPLALLEVGASAGLTLFPDLYSYDYGGRRVVGRDPEAPVIRCRPRAPLPERLRAPEVVWRAGIDLHPLDVMSDDDVAWLSCLVWPDEPVREERLRRAIATVRKQPPTIHRGDLLRDLVTVASGAPSDATLVVYHSAVLAYVDEDVRRAFAQEVRQCAVWLSNEGTDVLRCVGGTAAGPDAFLLVRDGRHVLARSDPHGAWIEWLAR